MTKIIDIMLKKRPQKSVDRFTIFYNCWEHIFTRFSAKPANDGPEKP